MGSKKTKVDTTEKTMKRKPADIKYTITNDTKIHGAPAGFPKTVGDLEDYNPEWYGQLMKEYPSTPSILRSLVKERQKEVKEKTGKRLTQEQIADELGVSKQTFSEWLKDSYDGKYRDKNLSMLADYFHVQPGYLKGEQLERIKDETADPVKIKSRNLERYLETLGFSFTHGYGMDPDDPLCEDPYNDEYYISDKDELVDIGYIDENGNKQIKKVIEGVQEYIYPYGKPLMITFPSGHKVLLRENTFDSYCEEFEEWIGFFLKQLLSHAAKDDIKAGTIPEEIDN